MKFRPKYKLLIRLKQNIWNTRKPLVFKKLKWKKIKRLLFFTKQKPVLNNFRIRNFYNLMLNMKKIISNTFGPLKSKQISKIIKKSYKKGLTQKSESLTFNRLTVDNVKYDNILYLMHSFESRLLTALTRLNIFSNLYIYLYVIKHSLVLVNNKVIKNPFFRLKNGDIISLNLKKLNLDLIKLNRISNSKFRNKFRYKCCLKSKHLLFSNFNYKFIYIHNPSFLDIEYLIKFHWDFFVYLLKLKR